ncbi:MAG: hypothetical protein CMD90_03345 [Gammaproteobacteria bacterium]|nr:hypothetical protein [Gammaproteobacteria bacterium]|tara:strand:- start:1504 stop:2733 length:1230 start_codon:yes stop_codon:yes gene_type:complete
MTIEIFQTILLICFITTFILGAVVFKTSFCTMGAVSDLVNIGDTGRMRSWFFAIAIAIFGVAILNIFNIADINLANSKQTSNPPYLSTVFMWPRYILGGILFGIGMTLASGCGNRTLVRIGGGNIKSILVLFIMGTSAYFMIFTNFANNVFFSWMQPTIIDFSNYGLNNQSVSSIINLFFNSQSELFFFIIPTLISLLIIYWCFKSSDFYKSFDNIFSGLVLGVAVTIAWYLTAGPMGQELMSEIEFLDGNEKPYATGIQGLTFVQPSAILIRLIESNFNLIFINFALTAAAGIICGSLAYSIIFNKFKVEWFASLKDLLNHVIGAILMGIGGVLALGCTIGQGVTGVSTLSVGSFISLAFIIFGSGITMKIQLYRMVYEDSSFLDALLSGLVDFRLLPKILRKLDQVS